jgi:hypothetical protein
VERRADENAAEGGEHCGAAHVKRSVLEEHLRGGAGASTRQGRRGCARQTVAVCWRKVRRREGSRERKRARLTDDVAQQVQRARGDGFGGQRVAARTVTCARAALTQCQEKRLEAGSYESCARAAPTTRGARSATRAPVQHGRVGCPQTEGRSAAAAARAAAATTAAAATATAAAARTRRPARRAAPFSRR